MLPLLNGYPLRLVVPGWFATYWIKMLSDIEVLSVDADDSYFMAKSYRMPAVPVRPGDSAATLAARVLVQEHRLYPAVLRRVVAGDPRPPENASEIVK